MSGILTPTGFWQPLAAEVLLADPAHDFALDASLKSRGLSLRVVVREIPPR